MTPRERVFTLIDAVKYVVKYNVSGSIVECGVWRGGSMMAVAKSLLNLKKNDRHLYLFDTYEGMTKPKNIDIDYLGRKASHLLEKTTKKINERSIWAYSPLQEVKKVLYETGYEKEKIHFLQGKVEDTLPEKAPQDISILRLDTDWYDSTKHELIHLFPRLSRGGVLIIDDYGYFEGAKKAVDEYFLENKIQIFLIRTDPSGRIGIKI